MQTAGSDGGGCPCGGTYMSPPSDLSMRWKNSLTPTRFLVSFFPSPLRRRKSKDRGKII